MEEMKSIKKGLIPLINLLVIIALLTVAFSISGYASSDSVIVNPDDIPLRLYYDEEAPYGNEDLSASVGVSGEEYLTKNLDDGWERWSIPLGNGYFGANVFGRTESERIQLTEKTLANPYYADGKNFGGLNNFSETYIDFGHTNSSVSEYSRELDLKTAISTVSYVYNGVTYNREYFTSYPDRALVIKLTASESGALDFVLRPTIPYEQDYMYESGDKGGKEGTVVSSVADGVGKIVLSGTLEYYGVDFVGLYNVYTDGTVSATSCTNADGDTDGTITVSDAECAYIVVTLGTDYELTSDVFTSSDSNKPTLSTDLSYAMSKVEGYLSAITDRIDGLDYESAYTALKEAHLADYTELFDRVRLNLGASAEELALTTDELLESYKSNGTGSYLETLYFQYGRYLLIASSRSGALPANLQGTWNRYELSPWSAGYWHNINVQMNYWPAFSTNLSETFDAYVDYNAAYMPQAQSGATSDINSFISQGFIDSSVLGKDGGNGWSIDTGAYPYTVWGHQRNGVGNLGFTTQLFWDYYLYTGDEALLRDVVYPILADAARYITKVVALDENGEYYLVVDTDSPEQYVDNEWYYTNGTTYAQSFAFLNNYYCLEAARELGIDLSNDTLLSTEEYSVLSTVMDQLDRYDPIVIGLSGQVKEFREEEYYGDLGEYTHRHISQLVGLYPGNLINSNTPAWLDAAKVVLTERGDEATGWGVAHRINLWARTKDGERAYDLVNQIISTNTATNLWDLHPPFQIDGNLGGTAGIAEMLLQSHEGCIAPLAAIPSEWESGSYTGLVARGGFEVGAAWEGGIARTFNILSGNGGEVSVYYGNISGASVIRNSDGAAVSFTSDGDDLITFNTEVGETYIISGFSADEEPAKVSGITQMVDFRGASVIKWNEQADAESYNVYYAKDNDAAYTLLGNTTANYFNFVPATLDTNARYTFKVSAVGEGGNEGEGALCYRNPDPATVDEVSATVSDTGALQLVIKSSAAVKQFKLYKRASSLGEWTLVTESAYPVIILEDYEPSYEYGISFADASLVESRIESISSLTPVGGALDYDPTNILAGYEFVGASTSTGYIWSPYVYANLTDGSRDNMCAIAYQKAGANLDGTLTLNGAAYLNELRIYPHYQSTEYLGTSLIVQTLTGGEWATALTVSSNAEMAAYMKTVGGAACLAIPLDNVLAEQIRIYIPGCYTLSNGTQRYIGIDEIECSGFLVSDELTEDISSNAFSSLTSENVTLTGASLHPGTGGLDVLFDGTISGANATRYATLSETVGGTHTLTLDLGEAAPLYTLKIWDFRGADYVDGALATRSNETTVELLVGESWYTVINAKPMSVAAAYTEFNLLGLTASQVRITFANTRAFDDGSMPSASIYEISCTTAGKNVEDTESNILSSLTSENVTLTGASLHPATGGLDVLFDGTTSGANATRYATLSETVGGTHTLTIDLGEAAPLYTLKIWDFRGADYVGGVIATRSNETTVELFNGTEWVTVIDRQPMTVAQSHTDFALGGITASQIRITFANTRAFDDGTMPSASIYEIACTTALPEAQDYVDRSDLLLAYEELAGTSVSDLFGLDGVKAMALLRFRDMLTDAEADADTVALYAAQIREYTENVLTCAEADTYGTFSGSEISEGAETVEITYSLSASILTSCPDAYIALGFADGTELNYPVSMMESAGGAYRLSVPLTPEITAGSISTRLVADDSNYSALSTASTVACEHTDTNGDDLCDACGVSLKVYAFTYVTSGGVSTDTDDFKEALIGAGAGGVINLNRDAEYYLTATIAGNAFASNITINLNGYDLIIWQGDESGNGNTSRIQIYNRAITVNGRAEGETKNGRLLCMQLVASYGSGEGNYPLFESTGGSPSLTLNNVDTTVGALWYTAGNAGSSVTVNGGIHDISLVSRNSFGWVGAAAAFTFEANGAIFHMGLEAIGQNNGGALVADRASARSTYTFNDCVITRYSYTSSFIKYATSTSYFYFNNTDIGCGINPETYSGCTAATSANFIFGAGTRFWADYVNTKGYTVADGCVYAAIANPADKYTFTKLQGGFATETETSVTFNANGSVVCIHADENRDGVCDKCLETVDIPDCTTHTDENGNRLCDVCGKELGVKAFTYVTSGGVSTDTDDFKEALIGAGAGGVINLNRDAEYYLTATIAGNAFASNITINLNGYDLIIWQGDESGNGNTSRIQIYNRAITVNGRAEGETKNGRLLCMQLVASYGSGEGNYPLFESTGGSPSLTLNNVDTTVGALWYTAGNAGSSVTVNGGIHDISLVSRNSFGWVGAAAAFTFEANGAIFHMGLEAIGQNNGGALVADRASARSTYTFNDCVITRYSYTSSFIKYATSTSYFYFNNTDIGCGINPETYSGCTAATSANFIFGAGTRFWADYVNTKGYTVADGCVYAAIANPADKYTFTKLQGGFATETETSVTFNANGSVVCIHADENRDGVCDKCLETVDIPDCTTHTDENGNRLCDVCGADTSVRIIYVMPDGSTSEVKVAHGTLVSNFPEYEKAEDIENGWVKIIFDGGWSTERFGAAISELTVTDTVTLYPSASECRAYMTDSKYNLSLYGNVAINIHVPTSSLPDTLSLISVTDGEDNVLVSVGSVLDAVGEEYDTYTYGRIRVTELDTVQTYKVRFEFMGVEFTQTIKPSISSYAENVLSSGINSAGKTVVADMVMYADAIYKYASGTSAAISDSLVSLASGVCTAAADSATFTGGYMGDAHNYADYISMIAFNVTNFEPSYEITFREEARVRDVELIIREAWLRGDGTYNKDDLICSVEKTYSGEYVTGVKATGVSIYNVDKTITIRFTFEDENGATHTVDATYTLNSYYTGMAADGVSVTEEDLTRAKAVFERMRAYSDTAAYYCFDEESANADSSLESKIKTVYYSDFGAKGDGVTDDFAAIYAAHEEANRLSDEGYTVRVKAVGGSHSNANYYIKNLDTASETFGKAVIIRTDTDWTGATFTVDDTSVTASTYEALKAGASTPIFKASADYTTSTAGFHCHWMIGNNDYDLPTSEMIPRFADGLLNASLKYNGLPEITSEQVLVKIVDTSHRNYVRFGGNYSSVQHEDIVLMNTATGEVDPSTPLLYDYHQVSRYEIYDIGSAPITIEGGSFITKYNNAFNSQTTPEYFLRGISIERANTTLKGLTQEYDYSGTNCITAQDGMGVTVDAVKGSPMQLIFVNTAHNVTLSDMSIYGGRHYSYGSSGLGVGNYTVCAYFATQLKINNVIQHNTSTEFRQPVMATNFCKNIVFRDNVMSRFDSHMGLYNVVIDGCDLEAINLIGGGKAIISNTKVYSGISGCVVTLRDDYASVWNGDVEFKNLTIETGGSSNVALFGMAYYNYNPGYYYSTGYFADKSSTDSYYAQDTSSRESGHYYSTVMPENVTADGITILKNGTEATSGVTLSVLTQFVGRVENFTYVDENGNDTTLSKSYQLHEYQGDITTYGASVNVGIWDENFLGIWNWSSKTTVTVKNPIKTTESITISGLASGIGYAEYYDFGTDKLHTFDLVFFNPTVTVNGAAPSWSPTGKNI